MATIQENRTPIATESVNPLLIQPCRIQKVARETKDTFTMELKPPGGGNGVGFSPGQFNMLYAYGAGEAPISISGDPSIYGTWVHTTRAVGTVTKALKALKSGDMVGVRGPYGIGWPVQDAEGKDVVVIAGGIGLAPLRPVIYHLLSNRQKYGNIALLYGARTPEDILYRKYLEKWRARFDMEIHITVDKAPGSWRGNVGVVTSLIKKAAFNPLDCKAMVCGPEVMMRFTVLELEKRGVEMEKIYVSMERNMKCGIGLCGHCQIGPTFVCKDGPVYRYDQIRRLFMKREI